MHTNVIDYNSPTSNMYGCEPCPECGSVWRWVIGVENVKYVIRCSDCGEKEPADLGPGE